MRKYLSTLVIVFLVFSGANAQFRLGIGLGVELPNTGSVDFLEVYINNEYGVEETVLIEQLGDANTANIVQTQMEGIDDNFAYVLQNGEGNEVNVSQVGFDINTVIIQSGPNNRTSNYNVANSSLTGSNLNSIIYQVGDKHTVNQDITGANASYIITQFGYGHTIDHTDTGFNTLPLQITQTGFAASVIITNGN